MNKYVTIPGTARSAMLACLAFIAVISGCSGGEIDTKDPARKVLAESVKAMGGLKRASGWKTRIEKGEMFSDFPGWGRLQAKCARYVEKPDKIFIDQDYSAFDNPFYFSYTYNNGVAWQEVNMGIRQNPATTAYLERQLKTIDGAAYYLTGCDTFFIVTDVEDDSLLTASRLERIGCVDEGDTAYFDICRETHLPLRMIAKERGSLLHTILDDYRKTGGLKVPFHLTVYRDGRKASEYRWEEISFGSRIDPEIFEKNRPADSGGP